MATLQWRRMAGNGGPPSSGLAGVTAAYDPGSRKVFLQDRNSFWSYDYDSDHYTVLNKQLGLPLHMNAVIDSSRKLFILFGDGHIFAIRIAPGSNYSVLDWTGAKGCDPLANESAPGLAFDSEKRVVAGWPNFGGTVYLFNPDSRACSAQIFGNGPRDSSHQGTAPSSAGTYGRFQYFPSMGVYALVSDADADAQLLRLTTRADSSAHAPTAN